MAWRFKILLLLAAISLSLGESEVFHVAPTCTATQSSPPHCHTLDEYAQNSSLFGSHTNVITLTFLGGEHTLSNSLTLFNRKVNTLVHVLQANQTSGNKSRVIIKIQRTVEGIYFQNVSNIYINDITVSSDYSETELLIRSIVHITLMQLATNGQVNLVMKEVNSVFITESNLSVLLFVNTGNVTILNTNIIGIGHHNFGIFMFCSLLSCTKSFLQVYNSLITNHFAGLFCDSPERVILITGSQFRENQFGIFIAESPEILIENSTIADSEHYAIYLYNTYNASIIGNCVMNNGFAFVSHGSSLLIQDTIISNNTFGVAIPGVEIPNLHHNAIRNCTFSFNSLSGIILFNLIQNVTVENCSFYENRGTPIITYQSIFNLMGETIFRDNKANRGGGVALYNSTVIFSPGSNTVFINNTAREYGGAIYTISLQNILPAIRIGLENAYARTRGMALVVNGKYFDANELFRQKCFYSGKNATVQFIQNTAILGGLSIFSATVYTDDCLGTNEIFKFGNDSVPDNLQISSNPLRVCFCISDKVQCQNRQKTEIKEKQFPGETFSVPVILVGYRFGRVAGSVHTHVVGLDQQTVIPEDQQVQAVALGQGECTSIFYTVRFPSTLKPDDSVILALTVHPQTTLSKEEYRQSLRNINSSICDNSYCTALQTTPIYIRLTLKDCPLGLARNETSGICNCDQILQGLSNEHVQINCEIQNQTGYIIRGGTVLVWAGVNRQQSSTDKYYWHRHCPRDYCIPLEVRINLKDPDTQCAHNRGGVLCGSCLRNYSLRLGDNSCAECPDSYLTLVILFAFLGILLVVVISVLDLTVAHGTINGLIFYANVVWANREILFSFSETQRYNTIPIAWINLDFGIITCFSGNFNQLTKTGLQFVYPVYIWCIAGLIILISRYSTRATKLFGNNSVAVLATLFLLSYGKLFRSILDVFTFVDLTSSIDTENAKIKVWELDGNIQYGESGHAVLIVLALFFLLLFLLPFTFVLLLVPFLRTISYRKPLTWINKLEPFFDTFFGPFKLKKSHQIWTGILLLTRVLVLVVHTATSSVNPNANILLLTIVAVLLLAYSLFVGLLYKELHVSYLETLYLLNLAIFSGTFLFNQTLTIQERKNKGDINTSIAIGFTLVLILGTITFHIIRRIKPLFKQRIKSKDKQNKPLFEVELNEPTVQVIDANNIYDSSRYQETLLDSTPS